MKNTCQMCMMPLAMSAAPIEKDGYCSYCFTNGEFVYKGTDVKEFKKITYQALRTKGTKRITAWFFTWMIGFAPHWKRPNRPAIKE